MILKGGECVKRICKNEEFEAGHMKEKIFRVSPRLTETFNKEY